MKNRSPFRYFRTSPEIIRLAVIMYVRFPLSLRAADHEGEGLESYAAERRDCGTALNFLRKLKKRYDRPQVLVTDKLSSCGVVTEVIGNADRRETGRWVNNRAENSHLPFRQRERAMLRFRRMRSLQKFAAVHSCANNHFNQERHLYSRCNFRSNRTAALAEWRQLCSAKAHGFRGKLRQVRIRLTPPRLEQQGVATGGTQARRQRHVGGACGMTILG